MAVLFAEMQKVLAYVAAHLDGDVSLGALARRARLSRFHLHRLFSNAIGETPGQLTVRLRLGRAAVLLLTTDDSVLDVALSSGFRNHETFCRAFQRRFGMTPRAYRKRGFAQSLNTSQVRDHVVFTNQVVACLGLYHIQQESKIEENHMTYSVTKKELTPQPVLVLRRRVKRSEIAATIAEALPHVFRYAEQRGIALAGLPFTRYVEVGPGLITMEPGMRIATSGEGAKAVTTGPAPAASGEAGMRTDTLPGGPVAITTHIGPYEHLPDAYGSIQQWIEDQGLVSAGAPWECYITDPGEHPDPKDWKTDVFWPLKP